MEKNNPIVYAVSDSIGETAESVVKATISQFVEQNFEVVRVPYVKDKEQIDRLVQEAAEHNAVICYTLVSPELREHLADRALAHDIQVVDVLGPMLKAIEKTTGRLPQNQAEHHHQMNIRTLLSALYPQFR